MNGPPLLTPSPALAPSPSPAPAIPPPFPSPGGHIPSTDNRTIAGSMGSKSAPLGLLTTVAHNFDSDKKFRWAGDEDGLNFSLSVGTHRNSNESIAPYLSCLHVAIESSPLVDTWHPLVSLTHCWSDACNSPLPSLVLLPLLSLIIWLMRSSITPGPGHCFVVADSGTTVHMFPDKLVCCTYRFT